MWNLENHTEFSLNAPAGLVCSVLVDEDKVFAGMEVISPVLHLVLSSLCFSRYTLFQVHLFIELEFWLFVEN